MQKKRVLLVDDSQIVLDAISIGLAEHYEITTASSGEEAIVTLRMEPFDLVLTDLMMEGVNGIQVLEESKKIDPEICVLILTGFGDMASAIDALRLGADDYLLKPCDTEELILRMNNCLTSQELKKKVKLYEDILPICSYCKTIRDDTGTEYGKGEWMSLEEYLNRKSNIRISHGCCPKCFEREMKENDLK